VARACVFCGDGPVTAEHLWPDWLRRREDIRENRTHTEVLWHRTDEPVRRDYDDHPFKRKARVVCRDCNNTWMSDLEQRAERLLDGMLAGRGRALHQTGQRTLAAWALKSAIMFDQGSPPEARVIPSEHYEALYRTGEPPIGVHVWVGAYDESQTAVVDVVGAEVTAMGQEDPPERNVYVRTFTIGSVAFQVFGTTNPVLYELDYTWPEPNVHRIWPYRGSITWVPQPALTDLALGQFGSRIIRDLAARSMTFEP
jgi:hypothetical protein